MYYVSSTAATGCHGFRRFWTIAVRSRNCFVLIIIRLSGMM